MSWTSHAEVAADTSELGSLGRDLCGRCRATGLHPNAYAPLTGATLALGVWPLTGGGHGYAPFASDRELVDQLLDFGIAILGQYDRVVTLVRMAALRQAELLAWIASATKGDPVEAWQAELVDCTTALEVLAGVPRRLRAAAGRVAATPAALGETYVEVYRLVAAGRVLPYNGRWLTGEMAPTASGGAP
ncbi:hypothetical protein [Microbispora sp. GKU 823]|uniref:hypothetical protein n=1 Tax=Microbispora sp. GKU 823 TaxID=1652100 RepID=UPI0009A32DBD|nr:hypothetical protein [Microbispora sp. GKU 823]OPG10574.1 hypothetical protein B1L11_23230 [Microbispora sp. GKU 823]